VEFWGNNGKSGIGDNSGTWGLIMTSVGGGGGEVIPPIYLYTTTGIFFDLCHFFYCYHIGRNHTVAFRTYLALAIRLGSANSARRGDKLGKNRKRCMGRQLGMDNDIYGYQVQRECVHYVKMSKTPRWKYTRTHMMCLPTYVSYRPVIVL
jgi:hypothetical protein